MQFSKLSAEELYEGDNTPTEEEVLLEQEEQPEVSDSPLEAAEGEDPFGDADNPNPVFAEHHEKPVTDSTGAIGAAALLSNGLIRVIMGQKSRDMEWEDFQHTFLDPYGQRYEDLDGLINWQPHSFPTSQPVIDSHGAGEGKPVMVGPLGGLVSNIIHKFRAMTSQGPEKTRFDNDDKIQLNRNTFAFNKALQHTTSLKEKILRADILLDEINDDFQVKYLSRQFSQKGEEHGAAIQEEFRMTFFGDGISQEAAMTGDKIAELFDTVQEIQDVAENTIRWGKRADTDVNNITDLYSTLSNKLQNSDAADLISKPGKDQTLGDVARDLQEKIAALVLQIMQQLHPGLGSNADQPAPSM